jgi:hypothetical protein
LFRPARLAIPLDAGQVFAPAVIDATTGVITTPEVAYRAAQVAVAARAERAAVPGIPTPDEVTDCRAATPVPTFLFQWVQDGVNAIIKMMAPQKALAIAKRQLRREVRKPSSMSIRQFVNRVRTINDVEMKWLPPFQQCLERDEILEILYHAIPANWRSEMERQGFNYAMTSATEFIKFCERLELAATQESSASKPQGNQGGKKSSGHHNSKSKSGKDNDNRKKSPEGSFYCKIHGADHGHNTDECYTLKNMLEKQKGDGKFKNKTWTKKESNSVQKKGKGKAHKAAVQKEINMLIKKGALIKPKKGKKASKKRSVTIDTDDDDSDDSGSINMMDAVDLSEFKYDDMDNLKIESDDDDTSFMSATSS